jgi:hypothetical protein
MERGGLNLYTYAQNEPTDKTDSLGLYIITILGPPIAIPNPSTNVSVTWECANADLGNVMVIQLWFNPNAPFKNAAAFNNCVNRVRSLWLNACACGGGFAQAAVLGKSLEACFTAYGPGVNSGGALPLPILPPPNPPRF